PSQRCRVMHMAWGFSQHWKLPGRAVLEPLLGAYHAGLDAGDFEYGCYAIVVRAYYMFFVGIELPAIDVAIATFAEASRRVGQGLSYRYFLIWHQAVENLMGKSADPAVLSGAKFDVHTAFAMHKDSGDNRGLLR